MRAGENSVMSAMHLKFGASANEEAQAQSRVLEILGLLANQLAESADAGHRYFMGSELSALDIHWATFCNLVSPLPPDQLTLPPDIAAIMTASDPETQAALAPELLAHRDFVYRTHLELPVVL
jgi:glutathione S-transferase